MTKISHFVSGGSQEVITRKTVTDELGKIDSTYKKHTTAVLAKVQLNLNKNLGFALVSSDKIVGMRGSGKKDEFYITNNLSSPRLIEILSKMKNNAYFGFMCVVFFSVYTNPGKKISGEDLLRAVRKVDKRFPVSIISSTDKHGVTACPVPELEDDFLGLINRMKKVRICCAVYVIVHSKKS